MHRTQCSQGELRAKAHPATAASPTALSLPPPRALAEDALLSRYASDGGDGGVGGVCTAPALKAKAWLDAAREGRLDVMKQALEEEPSLLFLRGVGLKQTAQHWAAGKGHVRMLRWLLHCGAAVDAANANGHTALHAAAAAGQIAAALAPSDASPPPPAGRPRGRMQREARREEVGAEELPPLLAAAAKGDVAALRAALDGADVRMCDEGGRGATHLAARGGHAACLRALIEAGAPMDALTSKGNSAVAVAAKHRQWAAAVLLLDHGAKGDALALLHAARGAESVDARGVQLRLCAAGGMWPGDSDGVDALMLAAAAGDGGALARLLELRADPRAVDHRGMSPLHHCAGKGDCRCATILVEARASLHASDQSGDTPLHIAGRRGHAELYGLLLDAGADRSAENARVVPGKGMLGRGVAARVAMPHGVAALPVRSALLTTSLAVLLSISPVPAAISAMEPPSFSRPSAAFLIAAETEMTADAPPPAPPKPARPAEISYLDLKALLNQCIDGSSDVCKVDRVDFDDAVGETATALVEGQSLRVLGIPEDNPNNDSSPYKLVAKLRDAKVPFTFPFSRTLKETSAASESGSPRLPSLPSLPTLTMPKLPF
ncbi:hypothetical protein AB1Y20_005484 [Prymnesium parvum]|uniref:Uncharacterized protein n=1 Tax=Prymnesium parvum TaxID=97485 RepID=A0AB34J4W3_PRYPA